MKANFVSSRVSEEDGDLRESLLKTAERSAKELYRRIEANRRTEVQLAISQHQGAFFILLNAGPFRSEEEAYELFAELANQKEIHLKAFRSMAGEFVEDHTDDAKDS